jgi:hypothetical protein
MSDTTHHQRAVRFFWCLLIGATTVSLAGNIVHAVLKLIPTVYIQIGAAAVPPIALLASVHGIGLAVRAGASGRVYRCAVTSVAVIGVGAFVLSFVALQSLMTSIGYSGATAWVFPAIIDTTVAVSTTMLVALGDRPARRTETASAPTPTVAVTPPSLQSAFESDATVSRSNSKRPAQTPVPVQPEPDADFAAELIASGVTTQPVQTVIAVLGAIRDGASINAAATASGVHFRTAERIVKAAGQRQLEAAS